MRVIHNTLKVRGNVVALIDGGFIIQWDNGEQNPYSYSEAEENVIWADVDYSKLEQTTKRIEAQMIIMEVEKR